MPELTPADFNRLDYIGKLRLLNEKGKLLHTQQEAKIQITVYKLGRFFVKLERRPNKTSYDSIIAMDKLPPGPAFSF